MCPAGCVTVTQYVSNIYLIFFKSVRNFINHKSIQAMFTILKIFIQVALVLAGISILLVSLIPAIVISGIVLYTTIGVLSVALSVFIFFKNKNKADSFEYTGKNYKVKQTVERTDNSKTKKTEFTFGSLTGHSTLEIEEEVKI